MKNKQEELQEKADFIRDSMREDGVVVKPKVEKMKSTNKTKHLTMLRKIEELNKNSEVGVGIFGPWKYRKVWWIDLGYSYVEDKSLPRAIDKAYEKTVRENRTVDKAK